MIQHIIIEDYEERYAPPEGDLLKVALSGDVAFLAIGSLKEDANSATFQSASDRQIAVPAQALIDALMALARAQQRDDLQRVVDGKEPPRGLSLRVPGALA